MIPKLPHRPRNSDAFEDERHLLGWLVARLTSRCRSELRFSNISAESAYILDVVAPLLRAQIAYGRAVYRLTAHDLSEAAYPITRSMLEVWAETAYLLENHPTVERAVKNQAWTLLTLSSPPAKPSKAISFALTGLRRRFPHEVQAVEGRHPKQRTRHHSGMGWKALVAHSCGEDVAELYGFLSWHTHAIAQVVADVQYEEAPEWVRTRYKPARPDDLAAIDVCTFAVRALHGSWDAFYAAYGHAGEPAR